MTTRISFHALLRAEFMGVCQKTNGFTPTLSLDPTMCHCEGALATAAILLCSEQLSLQETPNELSKLLQENLSKG